MGMFAGELTYTESLPKACTKGMFPEINLRCLQSKLTGECSDTFWKAVLCEVNVLHIIYFNIM